MTMEPIGLAMSCAADSSETLMCFLVQVRIMSFWDISLAVGIQVCPKKGITPTLVF